MAIFNMYSAHALFVYLISFEQNIEHNRLEKRNAQKYNRSKNNFPYLATK